MEKETACQETLLTISQLQMNAASRRAQMQNDTEKFYTFLTKSDLPCENLFSEKDIITVRNIVTSAKSEAKDSSSS